MKNPLLLFCTFTLLVGLNQSCNSSQEKFETQEGLNIRKKVDQIVISLDSVISSFNKVARIDHSRLAEGTGVYTPPSIVTIFSNPKVNSDLIKINPLVGLDLPYKILCFSEPDISKASIAYTSPEFIIQRHGLSVDDLKGYSRDINSVIDSFPKKSISVTDLSVVKKNYGIITKKSAFDFHTTLERLKNAIGAQGDTQIFAEVDYKNEAVTSGIYINPTTLILFGAPKPGGKAMHKCPKIGLDAFCQKLLVYENNRHEVLIAYNDIIKFAELYYQKWTIPQRVINYRLNRVFEKAINEK